MLRTSLVLLTSVLALSLGACSSKSKKADAPAAKPAAAAATTAPAAVTAKKGGKAVSKKAAAKTEAATAQPAAKEAAAKESGSTVTCKSGSTVRELTVVTKDGHCAVNYTKDGATTEIATGALTSNHCKETQEKVKENLVKAGYSCE